MRFRISSARRCRAPLAVAAAVALTGCVTLGPDYQEPRLPLPGAWSGEPAVAAPGREDVSRWWARLGDPQLTSLVARAMQANPDLRSALARVREARARRALAAAQGAPSIDATAVASASRRTGGSTTEAYSAGFDASWEIDVFGGRRRALEAAEADLQASAATADAARVTLAAETARNYIEVRAYQTRLAIASGNLASQSETLQLTEWRSQAGLVSSLDVEQARANREQTRAQIPALLTGLAEAQHRLAILLGMPPDALRQELTAAAPMPEAPLQIAIGIPADVLRQRPDVHAAERTLAAETARIGQAEAARYPAFALGGSIGLDAASLGALANDAAVTRSLLARLAAPLFDAGRLQQQVEIQRTVQERARASYESAVLSALEEVENALAGFANSRTRRAALGEALTAARNAALLANHRYTAGLVDFQTVLDTQRSMLNVEDSLATSTADGMLALIQLYKALGGGWTPLAEAAQAAATGSAAAQERTRGDRP